MVHGRRAAAALLALMLTAAGIFPSYATKTDVDEARENKANLEAENPIYV